MGVAYYVGIHHTLFAMTNVFILGLTSCPQSANTVMLVHIDMSFAQKDQENNKQTRNGQGLEDFDYTRTKILIS